MDWPGICEECEDGKIFYNKFTSNGVKAVWGSCSKCNGTGERDLTADEAAECLWDSGYTWTPRRRYYEDKKTYRIEIDFHSDSAGITGCGIGETLPEALNAACRAIKEKENGNN